MRLLMGCLMLVGLLTGCADTTAPTVCVIRTDSLMIWSNGQITPVQQTAVCRKGTQ